MNGFLHGPDLEPATVLFLLTVPVDDMITTSNLDCNRDDYPISVQHQSFGE